MSNRRLILGIGTGAVVAAASAFALINPSTAYAAEDVEAKLNEIRAATERFKDVNVALAEGYIADPSGMCVTAEMEGYPAEQGAMGIHYFRPDLLEVTATEPRVNGTGTNTDFLNPSVVIYEPQADGSLELVAIENLVFQEAWHAAGNGEQPTFLGRQWEHMVNNPDTELDEAHGFEAHYDQHVWVFRDNPLGPLEPFNPNVTCEHHGH